MAVSDFERLWLCILLLRERTGESVLHTNGKMTSKDRTRSVSS